MATIAPERENKGEGSTLVWGYNPGNSSWCLRPGVYDAMKKIITMDCILGDEEDQVAEDDEDEDD